MGPGEPGFHEHYHAARKGRKLETKKPETPKKGTLDGLRFRHLEWLENQVKAGNMSKKTLSSRQIGLNQACDTLDPDGDRMGSLDADMPKQAFVYIRDQFGHRTGAAATCLKALRTAYKWGEDRGYSGFLARPAIHDPMRGFPARAVVRLQPGQTSRRAPVASGVYFDNPEVLIVGIPSEAFAE